MLRALRDRTGTPGILWLGRNPPTLAPHWPDHVIITLGEASPGFGLLPEATAKLGDYMATVVPPESPIAVGMPFFVLAMTEPQARQLLEDADKAKDTLERDSYRRFLQLKSFFKKAGASALLSRYSDRPEHWKPFPSSLQTAWEVIEEVVTALNTKNHPQLAQRLIKAQYYPFDVLANGEDEPLFRAIYQDVALTGCVIVADELSLFHWDIRSAFSQSYLHNSPQAALVTISPFDQVRERSRLIETEFRNKLRIAFTRFEDDYDSQFEFGISDRRALIRWLHHSLPQAVMRLREPAADPGKIRQFFGSVGLGDNRREMADHLYFRRRSI